MSIFIKFKNSSKELNKPVNLTICAMLLAIRIVIGSFANISLSFSPFAKISFNFIPIVIAAYLFGPVPSAIISAVGDVLSIILSNPTAISINPLVTLSSLIEGLIYGILLYKITISYKPIIISKILVFIISQIIIMTFTLYLIYGVPIYIILLNRVLLLLPMSVIEVFIDFYILKLIDKILPKINQS